MLEPTPDDDWDQVAAFFQATSAAAFAVAVRGARTRQDAEDAVQEAYMRIYSQWSKWTRLDEDGRRSRLRRVLAQVLAERYRKGFERFEVSLEDPMDGADQEARPALDPDLANAYSQVCRAIAAMPVRRREIAALHWIAGFERSEVAKALGLNAVTIRIHLRNARADLERAGMKRLVQQVLGELS